MFQKTQDQEVFQAAPTPVEQTPVALQAEEIEAVVAPKLAANHNENVMSVLLGAEEIEAVIAPRLAANHNETILA